MTDELAVIEDYTPATLFGTDDPVAVIQKAKELASPLADLIDQQGLYTNISGKKHVRIEGWTLLGSMLGVFPVTVWTREVENGWEARVEARTRAGEVVGAAEAECLRTERSWAKRDDYTLRSMAQTRAASKALRLPLGFIMQLGGFDATPAEDVVRESMDKTPKADPVEAMYRKVQARLEGVDRDTAEAMVFEAATRLGFVWPDPGLGKAELNRLLKEATGE